MVSDGPPGYRSNVIGFPVDSLYIRQCNLCGTSRVVLACVYKQNELVGLTWSMV